MYNEGLDDILAELDATNARGRQQDMIRSFSGPRIPYMHDLTELEWRPIPKLKDVRHSLKGGASTTFVRYTKNSGDAISEPQYIRPKVLDHWTAIRVVAPDRNLTSNHAHPPRFHSHSEPFPEPTDDMLDKSHREWLQKHNEERRAQMYPVAHALDRVEKAKKAVQAHQDMREKTVDLVSRQKGSSQTTSPKFGLHAKQGLAKALLAVKTTRAFNKLADIDPLKAEEDRDIKRLQKAKSAPVLQHHHPPPAGTVEHLRRFQYTNPIHGTMRTTTPWMHVDEIQDLKTLNRFGQTIRSRTW